MSGTGDENTDGIEFLRFVYTKRKPILITFFSALLLAGIVTATMPRRYSSQAIVFPVNNNNVESVVDNPTFGYDVEADRLLQLLESDEVRDSVIAKFNLVDYYGIDKNSPDWNDLLKQKFVNDVSYTRTPYMSVMVETETSQPELSADMANYIIHLADGVRNRIFRKNELAAFHAVEKEFNAKKEVVDTLKKEIARLRGNSESDLFALVNLQGEVQTTSAIGKGGMSTDLERALNQYIFEQSRLNEISARYEKAKAQCDRPITQVYVVDQARPSYKKVSPSYLLNLSLAGIASLFFSVFFLLFFEKMRVIRQSPNQE